MSIAAIRPATDADNPAIIEIVRTCWTAYPGVVVDVDGELPELRHFAGHCEASGGRAWIAELDGRIVGCIGMVPEEDPGTWLLVKLNVLPEARRRGIAAALVREAETAARAQDAIRMALWSDTRFTESHALYASLGYERMPMTRELGDLSNTVEYRFRKSL